ncbi:hypothetical protein G1K52_11940 [Tenacibaculum finnmarkense]|uniref:hypothetical protein n=1 Tax=Tenacibaculum finnmarkense TaxID=2781243 RepID=UPI001EFAFFA4|nr:hypothetical protein [Tenacibaculum finnmarkense]MCG8786471.1 hypothetical protein [Tenacibaculum finnmarkense]
MKTKKAIETIEFQIRKIDNLSTSNLDSWKIQTETFLHSFLKKKEYTHKIKNFYLSDVNASVFDRTPKSENELKTEMKDFLNDCLFTLSTLGIKKEPIENWFSKLPNWLINLGLPALCFVSFGLGILFTNNNNYELKKENSKLKKSLLKPSDTITNQHKYLSSKPK